MAVLEAAAARCESSNLSVRTKFLEGWVSGLYQLFAKQSARNRVHRFESCTFCQNMRRDLWGLGFPLGCKPGV